ncbi:hypothetical protein FRC02_004334 [Tulasnella sp. 418]|nr:hypothetical protein FRC02_004334 [Tulasnella sp. 418]
MAKFALTSTVTLTSGYKMPILGLGVYLNRSCGKAIDAAIQAGYRHIDSAIVYKNEAEVGDAIRKAIEESGGSLKREDLFITSKVTTRWHGYNNTLKAVEESLERFKFGTLLSYRHTSRRIS